MAKPLLILDQYFRLVDELFRPTAYARLSRLTDIVGGDDKPMPRDEIEAHLAEAEFLVAARPTLSAGEIERASKLRATIEVSGAFNPGLDYEACFERGIEVLSSMPGFRFAVAEMAAGMMIAGARGLVTEHEAFREGNENWVADMPGRDFSLYRQTIGFVGYGMIARECHRLIAAFNPVVRAYDPWLEASGADVADVELGPLETVLHTSNVLVIAASPTDQNRGLITDAHIRMLPDGALVALISRAHLVDFPALMAEANSGRIKVATDVYPEEPVAVDDPLRGYPNVILSPHRAAAVPGGRHPIGDMIVADIEAILDGRPERQLKRADPETVRNMVNAYGNAS